MSRGLEFAAALGGTALAGFGVLPFLHHELPPEVWFEVRWPRDVEPDAALALLRHVAAHRRPPIAAFEIRVSNGQVAYRLGSSERDAGNLQRTILTFLPGALLEPVDTIKPIVFKRAVEARLTSRERSLRTDDAPQIVVADLGITQCRCDATGSPETVIAHLGT